MPFETKPLTSHTNLCKWLLCNKTPLGSESHVRYLVCYELGLPVVITNRITAARSSYFVFTRMITDRIGLHSVLLPLLIRRVSVTHLGSSQFFILFESGTQ